MVEGLVDLGALAPGVGVTVAMSVAMEASKKASQAQLLPGILSTLIVTGVAGAVMGLLKGENFGKLVVKVGWSRPGLAERDPQITW